MEPQTGKGFSKKVIALSSKEKLYRLHKERVVLGSVISADVRLSGEGVSPIHAVLEITPSGATVYDLASDTGVFVNGKKVVTQALQQGDEITIGRHTLKLAIEDLEKITPDTQVRESAGRKLFMNPKEDVGALLLEDERVVEDIFDYSRTNRDALQVVMSWRGTVLDVEHFVDERTVTVGQTRDSHFGIPPILGAGAFKLITQAGGTHTLNLDDKMKGVMQRKGELKSLESLKGTASQIPFEKGDFAKLSIGEVDFYLSFTQAPPTLKKGRLLERDPLFLKVVMTSLALTLLTVVALLRLPVDQQLEAEEVPERIATILYQPEKFVRPPVPVSKAKPETVAQTKPVPQPPAKKPEPRPEKTVKVDVTPKNTKQPAPKEMTVAKNAKQASNATKQGGQNKSQNVAKEGEGARARGKEGARGNRRAAPGKDKQTQAFRPSPQGGPGRGSGNSQVKDEGNVDFLKGASSKILDVLGNSAAQLGKGGQKLKGFGGFTTQGEGGLALSGSGSGGGGDAASLGGLGKQGRGGGKVGTGLGAAGAGNGIIGGSSRVVLRTGGPEETVVVGTIDADAIAAALAAHRDRFRLCYEKEINAENPPGAGSVGTSFTIASNGRVSQAGIESTTLKNARTEGCIVGVIKTIQFPIPRGAGIVQVTYPFKFSPVGN